MIITTPTLIQSMNDAFSQFFDPIYEDEFRQLYPTKIDFYENHIYFVTLTLNPHKVSLTDNSGISRNACSTQKIADARLIEQLKSKNIFQLIEIGVSLNIPNCGTMTNGRLISEIVAKCSPKQRPVVRSKPHPLNVFEHFHYMVTKACMENMQRKRQLQPRALAFVDFENTRNGGSVDPRISQWPHVHALVLVRPEHIEPFEGEMRVLQTCFKRSSCEQELDALRTVRAQRRFTSKEDLRWHQLHMLLTEKTDRYLKGDIRAVRSMDFSRYNRNGGPLSHLVGYSKKGVDNVPVHWVRKGNRWVAAEYSSTNDLFDIFPRQL